MTAPLWQWIFSRKAPLKFSRKSRENQQLQTMTSKVLGWPPPSHAHIGASEEMACAFLPVEGKTWFTRAYFCTTSTKRACHEPFALCHCERPERSLWGLRKTAWEGQMKNSGSKETDKTSLCFMVSNNTIRIRLSLRRPRWETSTGSAINTINTCLYS